MSIKEFFQETLKPDVYAKVIAIFLLYIMISCLFNNIKNPYFDKEEYIVGINISNKQLLKLIVNISILAITYNFINE